MLNSIIKKATGKSDYSNYFISNNKPNITKSKEIANYQLAIININMKCGPSNYDGEDDCIGYIQ